MSVRHSGGNVAKEIRSPSLELRGVRLARDEIQRLNLNHLHTKRSEEET